MEKSRYSERELDELLDRRLRDLPAPRAPETLAVRVLGLIAERQRRPWWQKSWSHWPGHWQAVFLVLALGAAVAVGWGLSGVDPVGLILRARDTALARFGFIQALVEIGGSIGAAIISSAKSAGQTFWIVTLTVAGLSYLGCVALGTFCYRLIVANPNRQLI